MGGGPMNGYGSSGGGMVWPGSPPQANSYEFSNEYGGPLSRLKESVNSLEALNAMEKSISEQVCKSKEFSVFGPGIGVVLLIEQWI